MKTLLIIAAIFICSCSWSKAEIAKEVVYTGIKAIDWRQTRTIAKHPDEWYEVNPALGEHPSVERVDNYFLITGIAHPIITHILPRKHTLFGWEWSPRAVWQNVTIGISAGCVAHNYSVGIRIDR